MKREAQKSRPRGRRPPAGSQDERPVDTRPYLCIPYWNAPRFPGDESDNGQLRPLPNDVISWDCVGIHPGPYSPGTTLDVTVDVRNSADGNATAVATVIVYWADPTVGFAKPTFFGVATVPVDPRGSVATTDTISAVISAGAPDHICLLVKVTNTLDTAGTVCDPVNDRHWAQRNILSVAASMGSPVTVPFLVANPFEREGAFVLAWRALDEARVERLALRERVRPTRARPRAAVLDVRGTISTERGREGSLDISLGPRAAQLFHLQLELDSAIGAGEVAALELSLHPREASASPVGSLGVLIRGVTRESE